MLYLMMVLAFGDEPQPYKFKVDLRLKRGQEAVVRVEGMRLENGVPYWVDKEKVKLTLTVVDGESLLTEEIDVHLKWGKCITVHVEVGVYADTQTAFLPPKTICLTPQETGG